MRTTQHFANRALDGEGAAAQLTESLRAAFGVHSTAAAQGEVLARRVHGWGGDPAVFARMFADAVTVPAPGTLSDAAFRLLGTVAAWRSGALGFRTAALEALGTLPTEVGAACLGIDDSALAGFLLAQRSDRYAFPGLPLVGGAREVAQIGGFAGFGGPWLAPPRPIRDGSGALLVMTGDDCWKVTADAFGHRITPFTEPGQPDQRGTGDPTENGVLKSIEDSYFVRLLATTASEA